MKEKNIEYIKSIINFIRNYERKEDGAFATLENPLREGHYVQFIRDGNTIVAEAASNHFLKKNKNDLLSDDKLDYLFDLGWLQKSSNDNFIRVFDLESLDEDYLADRLYEVLVNVYEINEDYPLIINIGFMWPK